MQSVFPTGTTVYDPERCWNGYTLLDGGNLVDMNGGLRKTWDGIGSHAKLIPNGCVLGQPRDRRRIVQLDWEDKTVWQFNGSDFGESLYPVK